MGALQDEGHPEAMANGPASPITQTLRPYQGEVVAVRYNVEIREADSRDGAFLACCRETGLQIESRDPEHDACHALRIAGLPDGPVQFWRDGARTLSQSSIVAMGRRRIELGQDYPLARPKRKNCRAEIFATAAAGGAETGKSVDDTVRECRNSAGFLAADFAPLGPGGKGGRG